jgi:heme-degrading monooxygenase HmoA
MATLLVKQSVKDFDAWKKVFDSVEDIRKSSGERSYQIYRKYADGNDMVIMFEWDTAENARKYFQSPQLKAAVEKAGVIGIPKPYSVNEV